MPIFTEKFVEVGIFFGVKMTYLTDEIKIRHKTTNSSGVTTHSDSDIIPARIKDNNRLVINNRGQEVLGFGTIMIEVNNTLAYGDYILIVKRKDIAFSNPNKEFIIHKFEPIGAYSEEFIRIEI
jgi:hypothetical protein